MKHLKNTEGQKQVDYNEEPVFYCKICLSLAIKSINGEFNFCDTCMNTDIESTSIEKWEILYKQKYGTNYINKTK